jgi:hypothetical protein
MVKLLKHLNLSIVLAFIIVFLLTTSCSHHSDKGHGKENTGNKSNTTAAAGDTILRKEAAQVPADTHQAKIDNAVFKSGAIDTTGISYSESFSIKQKGVFEPQNKTVIFLADSMNNGLILFKTKLQVNTDGTPISYHPYDLTGNEKAINTIGNAIAVYKNGSNKNLCLSNDTYAEAIDVFKKFRDSNFDTIPSGYTIVWKNVLIPEKINGVEKPCIIKTGEYKGYFASATSLTNGLTGDKGECQCNNQVNPLKVPALVLAGGSENIVKKFGANIGDLLIAYNPENKNVIYAVINDLGPKTNLGEGSVLLNMKLLNKTEFPKTRKDTYKLATGDDIIIAIIPGSKGYNPEKPFTADNIRDRVNKWLGQAGFKTENDLITFLELNKGELQ